jgi:hypothetical protein
LLRVLITVVGTQGERRVRAVVPKSAKRVDLLWALGVGDRGSVLCEEGDMMERDDSLERFLGRLGLGREGSGIARLRAVEEGFGSGGRDGKVTPWSFFPFS